MCWKCQVNFISSISAYYYSVDVDQDLDSLINSHMHTHGSWDLGTSPVSVSFLSHFIGFYEPVLQPVVSQGFFLSVF